MMRCFLFFLMFTLQAHAGEFLVTKVYDGDSILVKGHGVTVKVRLIGIDAPEMQRGKKPGQPFASQSKFYLTDLILNKYVEIKGYGLDPFNRVLGEILVGMKNINKEMVSVGLVEVYRGKSPKGFDTSDLKDSEECSRMVKRGIWSLGEAYMSPMDYRKLKL